MMLVVTVRTRSVLTQTDIGAVKPVFAVASDYQQSRTSILFLLSTLLFTSFSDVTVTACFCACCRSSTPSWQLCCRVTNCDNVDGSTTDEKQLEYHVCRVRQDQQAAVTYTRQRHQHLVIPASQSGIIITSIIVIIITSNTLCRTLLDRQEWSRSDKVNVSAATPQRAFLYLDFENSKWRRATVWKIVTSHISVKSCAILMTFCMRKQIGSLTKIMWQKLKI